MKTIFEWIMFLLGGTGFFIVIKYPNIDLIGWFLIGMWMMYVTIK